jgi:hypothetical protein
MKQRQVLFNDFGEPTVGTEITRFQGYRGPEIVVLAINNYGGTTLTLVGLDPDGVMTAHGHGQHVLGMVRAYGNSKAYKKVLEFAHAMETGANCFPDEHKPGRYWGDDEYNRFPIAAEYPYGCGKQVQQSDDIPGLDSDWDRYWS